MSYCFSKSLLNCIGNGAVPTSANLMFFLQYFFPSTDLSISNSIDIILGTNHNVFTLFLIIGSQKFSDSLGSKD